MQLQNAGGLTALLQICGDTKELMWSAIGGDLRSTLPALMTFSRPRSCSSKGTSSERT